MKSVIVHISSKRNPNGSDGQAQVLSEANRTPEIGGVSNAFADKGATLIFPSARSMPTAK